MRKPTGRGTSSSPIIADYVQPARVANSPEYRARKARKHRAEQTNKPTMATNLETTHDTPKRESIEYIVPIGLQVTGCVHQDQYFLSKIGLVGATAQNAEAHDMTTDTTNYAPPRHMTLDQSIHAWLDEKRADSVRTASAYEEILNDFRDTLQKARLDLDSEPALIAPLAKG